MDHLKWINDTYGHAAGDFAIRLVGQAIHETLPEGAVGSRIGGDEFVVFLAEGVKAEAFAKAFHSLKGTAALRDVEGQYVMDVTFSHRGVSVRLHDSFPEKTLQTNQSYMTETMRQIGIWNRL